MAKNNNLTDFLTGIADKIREVENSSDPIDPQDFEDKIEEVSQKYIPIGEYVLAPQHGGTFNTSVINLGGYAGTYMCNGELYEDYIDELYYDIQQGEPYIELYVGEECKIFADGLWEGFDNNTLGGYLLVYDPIPVTAAQWEDFKILTNINSRISVADYRVNTQPEQVLSGVEFAVDGNILMGAMPTAQIGSPNVRHYENVISFGATVSQGGYIDAGTSVGVGSYTMPTVVRGATTLSVANGGSNAITISAANIQPTGYVQGSTEGSSAKVYITRTSNTIYLRPNSTSDTAVMSYTVPPQSGKTVRPTINSQTVSVSGRYMTGDIVVEAIPNQRTENAITVNGPTVSVPYGYYLPTASSTFTKTVTTASHGLLTITLNTATGVITAQHTQATGYVTGHTATATLTIKLAEDNKF